MESSTKQQAVSAATAIAAVVIACVAAIWAVFELTIEGRWRSFMPQYRDAGPAALLAVGGVLIGSLRQKSASPLTRVSRTLGDGAALSLRQEAFVAACWFALFAGVIAVLMYAHLAVTAQVDAHVEWREAWADALISASCVFLCLCCFLSTCASPACERSPGHSDRINLVASRWVSVCACAYCLGLITLCRPMGLWMASFLAMYSAAVLGALHIGVVILFGSQSPAKPTES